jgi:hypothetical protein
MAKRAEINKKIPERDIEKSHGTTGKIKTQNLPQSEKQLVFSSIQAYGISLSSVNPSESRIREIVLKSNYPQMRKCVGKLGLSSFTINDSRCGKDNLPVISNFTPNAIIANICFGRLSYF